MSLANMKSGPRVTRRQFLQSGGAIVVAFGSGLGRDALAQLMTFEGVKAPGTELDSWVAVRADNTALVYLGRTEFGQGTVTAMLQIAAEELGLDMRQVRAAHGRDRCHPRPGKAGQQLQHPSGGAGAAPGLRGSSPGVVALAAPPRSAGRDLRVASGVVSVASQPGRTVTYGELIGDNRFDLKVTGKAPLKPGTNYRIVGKRVPRQDIPPKMAGTYEYIQHVRVPNMLHGRVVRPRGQGAVGAGAKVVSIDETSIAGIPGARVVRKGDFIGVVAPNEWHAVKAAAQLKVRGTCRPRSRATKASTKRCAHRSRSTARCWTRATSRGAGRSGPHRLRVFKGPYESHAPFAPNCAVADVRVDGAVIICPTQQSSHAEMLAKVLGMPEARVHVQYVEASGCFGHACYDDAAASAAIMSQAVGQPVRLQFMRQDEIGWDGYGPAHLAEVRAGADATARSSATSTRGGSTGGTCSKQQWSSRRT